MRGQSEMTAPVLVCVYIQHNDRISPEAALGKSGRCTCENETLALDGKMINNQYFWYQKIKYIIVIHKKVWYY